MKTAKLFKNGQSQAVRLPKEFRMEGDEVYIKKQGRVVILFESLDMFEDGINIVRNQPVESDKRETLFE